jgi:hypothetical protein
MSALNAIALLAAWEDGAAQLPVRRALILLAAACPEKSADEWAKATIGERDRRLLSLREQLFGERLEALATCPNCAERLELGFSTRDLCTPASAIREPLPIDIDGYQVKCRLPTSADLLEAAGSASSDARELLMQRCVTAARHGATVEPAGLPPAVLQAAMAEMLDADPQAEIRVALDCPACGHQWGMDFDVLSYLWSEIDDWAPRLLHEVHALAYAYGWSERDILTMSAWRRRRYLDMLAGEMQ